jgi:hypothetical protein
MASIKACSHGSKGRACLVLGVLGFMLVAQS